MPSLTLRTPQDLASGGVWWWDMRLLPDVLGHQAPVRRFAAACDLHALIVAQVVGRDKIKSMNPENKEIGGAYREDSVELKLTGISLEQLVDMMYRIEKGQHPLRITRLQVKKEFRDPHMFDVTATVSMLKPMESS